MTDKVNQAIEQATQNKRDEIATNISASFDALVANNPNNVLPESLFVELFLPYFIGEKVINQADRDVITDWISVAGTPMARVDIIDNAGKTLFAVPPLYDTKIINVANRAAGAAIADVYAEFSLRKNNSPIAAENFLASALLQTSDKITQPENAAKELGSEWEAIRARYRGNNNDVKGSNVSVDPNDDVIYD